VATERNDNQSGRDGLCRVARCAAYLRAVGRHSLFERRIGFADGFQIEYPEFEKVATPADKGSDSGDDVIEQCSAWLHVPAVCAGATGVIRTRLPRLETLLQGSRLSDRASQASDVWLELGFSMATLVADPDEGVLAQGTTMGDGVVSAEIELAGTLPQPQGPQPSFPPLNRDTFNYYVADLMLPRYREGTRRQWGSHMETETYTGGSGYASQDQSGSAW
jgi:hypothetical protein